MSVFRFLHFPGATRAPQGEYTAWKIFGQLCIMYGALAQHIKAGGTGGLQDGCRTVACNGKAGFRLSGLPGRLVEKPVFFMMSEKGLSGHESANGKGIGVFGHGFFLLTRTDCGLGK